MRPSLLNSRVSSPISYGTCSLRVVRTFPVCLKILLPPLSFLLVLCLLLLCLLLLRFLLRLALAPSKPPTLMRKCVCSLLSRWCISLRLDWIKTRFRLDLYCLYPLCRRRRRRSRLRRSRRRRSKNSRFVADPSSSEGWMSSSSRASSFAAFEKNDHQSRDEEEQ